MRFSLLAETGVNHYIQVLMLHFLNYFFYVAWLMLAVTIKL